MKKIFLTLICLFYFCSVAFAFEANYFRKFINQELYVTINVGYGYTKTILIRLDKIDYSNGTLIGKYNGGGSAHIQVKDILLVKEQQPNTHGIIAYNTP